MAGQGVDDIGQAHADDDAITRLLRDAGRDDARAADTLLAAVYDDLRRLAAARLARERPGQTLDATGLVHEAYLRLVGDGEAEWDNRGHFFASAAEAMRRILVERARRRKRIRHGGRRRRADIDPDDLELEWSSDGRVDILQLDEVLRRMESAGVTGSDVVKLRYFAGLTIEQTAEALDLAPATVKRRWNYARAWLCHELLDAGMEDGAPTRGGRE
ncbi:MAG: ECF-type sigma factor [Planctomycetota bacterium]|jgi:RNA polymerase sigma factor (TIGR02999 family)